MRRMRTLVTVGWALSVGPIDAATISGYVTEKLTGEPVAYANIIVAGKYMGSVTNHKGYFIITSVTPGKYSIRVEHISYQKRIEKCEIGKDSDQLLLKIEIESGDIAMQTVEVMDSVEKINSRAIQVGMIHQTTREIKQMPQMVEADVFRAVQYLPGVSAISDYSSGLYVRGGSQDQNLILIDGIDVYNPTHFGGLFSAFNTDAIRDVELLKSGYPAKYGGRLSSVLSVSNKDGNRKKMEGVARISILSSSLTLESPWKLGNQKGSYMVSARRTYLDIADKFISADLPDYYFYDGHAKFNWDISDRDKLSFSTYLGKDQLKLDSGIKAKIMWGNNTFSTQWIHLFNPQLFSHFILAGSQYQSRFNYSVEDTYFDRKNIVYDLTLRGLLNFKPNEYHMVDFGFDLKKLNVVFKVETNDENSDRTHMPDIDADNYYMAAYLQDSWDMTPVWTMQPGLRYTFNTGNSNLKTSSRSTNLNFEPRIALRRKLTVYSNVFISYGRFYQYITSINLGEVSPIDLWFPLDKSVDPGISNHFTAGYKTLLIKGIALDVEGYYKNYQNLVEYRPETDYEWNNETGKLADIYNVGIGYSFGMDVLMKTEWKSWNGFIGYAYGVTKRQTDHVNIDPNTSYEKYYFPRYDRTHQINIIENYEFNKQWLGAKWQMGLAYSFYTGQPFSRPEKWYMDADGKLQSITSYYDRYRLPHYSRFDLNFKMRWDKKSWAIEPYFQIINLFGSKNVWYEEFTTKNDPDDPAKLIVTREEIEMFPRFVFIGLNIPF